jgi:putative aldouronate transport system permease protein
MKQNEHRKSNKREASFVSPHNSLRDKIVRDKWLYILFLPGIAYYLVFRYLPMWGLLVSFQNYQPFLGLWKSKWVGLENFKVFINTPNFWQLSRNTLTIAMLNLTFFFPLPIIVALMLNELRSKFYMRAVQTVIYIPHFFSWVVIGGMTYILFTTEGGAVNDLLFSVFGKKINFLSSNSAFYPMIIGQVIWKETGWGTIIFLAALTGIDPNLYEAATIDGANRFQKLLHVSIPGISGTIIILLILRMGRLLDSGFEQLFVMVNAGNRVVGDVFDTYVYRVGIVDGRYSYTTAVGMFKSVIALLLLSGSNLMAKRFGHEGVI